MNTTDKYLACPEHHSGITRVRLNPDYVQPLPRLRPPWWLVSRWYFTIGGGILLGAFLARWVLS